MSEPSQRRLVRLRDRYPDAPRMTRWRIRNEPNFPDAVVIRNAERDCRARLADLSSDQIRDVIRSLITLRPRYPKISDELLFKLGDQLL
jgi:hypothetical protein